ncbi:hypothetical protein HQQ81_18425 [Microbacteriaceae bacterium VKM Ac-2854]|nr:hypothetical protein [Microbacteriaceae bacterium VKM Ac-2854]
MSNHESAVFAQVAAQRIVPVVVLDDRVEAAVVADGLAVVPREVVFSVA